MATNNTLCRLRLHNMKKVEFIKIDELEYLIRYECSRCGKEKYYEYKIVQFTDVSKRHC